jgi:hypothetical protein
VLDTEVEEHIFEIEATLSKEWAVQWCSETWR